MILDTLWTILQADTSQVDTAIAKTRQSTDELVDGLKSAETQGKQTGGTLTRVAIGIASAVLAAGGVAKAWSGTIGLAESTADLGDLADNLDIGVDKLDAFRKAMFATGGTSEGALSTIESLTRRMGKGFKDADGPIGKTLTGLGIKLTDATGRAKDSVDIITELSGALEGVNRAQAYQTLQQLGISDPKVIENILKGRKEMEMLLRVERERGVVNDAQVERARQLADAQDRLRANVQRLSDGFLNTFIPVVTKVIEWLENLSNWAGKHQDAIVGFFAAIAAIVAAVYLPAMISAAVATLAATWPIIAMVAAVTAVAAAFAIAYEDIKAFIDGNESLTGEILEKYPMVKTVVMGVVDAFRVMGSVITDVFSNALKGVKVFFEFLSETWDLVGKVMSALPTALVGGNIKVAQEVMGTASSSPMNSTTSNVISNQTASRNENNIQIGQVAVNTQATDARGIAGSIGSELNNQLLSVQAENSSKVTR